MDASGVNSPSLSGDVLLCIVTLTKAGVTMTDAT
jgi:hypothetical protein